jgi:hypothetical protein
MALNPKMRIRYWLMKPPPFSGSQYTGTGGFIYVACDKETRQPVKIGISSNPNSRLAQLRTASSSPLSFAYIGALNSSGYAIERAAHQMLARYRMNGEWFNCAPEIAVAAISVASSQLGEPIASVDPSRVDEIVAAVSGGASRSIKSALTWCYLIIVAAIIGVGILAIIMGRA